MGLDGIATCNTFLDLIVLHVGPNRELREPRVSAEASEQVSIPVRCSRSSSAPRSGNFGPPHRPATGTPSIPGQSVELSR